MKLKTTKPTFWAVMFFYLLIGFEFLYMASPFAAYFYSVYRPALSFLDRFPAIAWTTGFFLPHLVEETRSPILNSITFIGAVLAALGMFLFIICAFQVYYAKLFKKGVVTKGLYQFIRHPQYTAFSICSFGLLLLWPRFLSLIMFVTLLFAYYLLAKAEEKECERKFGESYKKYKDKTYRFLPIRLNRFNRMGYHLIPRSGKIISGIGFYVLTLFLSLQLACGIKQASVNSLYLWQEGNASYLSVYALTDEEYKEILELLAEDTSIHSEVTGKNKGATINYLLPSDMYISEIPMMKPKHARSHVHQHEYNHEVYKVIFAEANGFQEKIPDENILVETRKLKPMLEVWIDRRNKTILDVINLTNSALRYNNLPEPVF